MKPFSPVLTRASRHWWKRSTAPFMAAQPDLDTRISYKMLMYGLNGDFRNWICAVGVTKNAANLRFLYGVLLKDPRGVLRAGSATLKTIDYKSMADFDPQLVKDYVGEAVAQLDYFKQHAHEL